MSLDISTGACQCHLQDRQRSAPVPKAPCCSSWQFAAAIIVGLLLNSGIALAQNGSVALRTRSLAASCGACHGTDGAALAGMALPPLAGLSKDYFLSQMQSFRSGVRPTTVMQQIVKGFSDEQIEVLATYFSTVR